MTQTRFEWDANKDAENQKKHGVPLSLAQYAFADSRRVIAEDLDHSTMEKRYFCWRGQRRNSHRPVYLARWRHPDFWRRLLAQGKGNL